MTANRDAVASKLGWLALGGSTALAMAVATACGSSDNSTDGGTGSSSGSSSSGSSSSSSSSSSGSGSSSSSSSSSSGSGSGSGSSSSSSSSSSSGGGSEAGAGEGGGGDAGSIVVTSPAFTEGMTIPDVYTCAGVDTSPEIDWTAGPAATQSYAVVVSDLTATQNIHWVVWNLPPTTRSLPANLPTTATLTTPVMAEQVDLRTNPEAGTPMNGYFGPCPRGNLHSYGFAVYALDVATLPAPASTTSRSADMKAEVIMHGIANGQLTGTSSANTAPADAGAADAGGQ